jgi:hypothetical protein
MTHSHPDNSRIAAQLREAAGCFACSRFVPSEADEGIELATEALDALSADADLGVRTDGVRAMLADPANYDLYRLAPWCDALADKLDPPRKRKPKGKRQSLDRMIAQAEKKSGRSVTSITTPDGTTLHFGDPTPTPAKELDQWIAKHARASERH